MFHSGQRSARGSAASSVFAQAATLFECSLYLYCLAWEQFNAIHIPVAIRHAKIAKFDCSAEESSQTDSQSQTTAGGSSYELHSSS